METGNPEKVTKQKKNAELYYKLVQKQKHKL